MTKSSDLNLGRPTQGTNIYTYGLLLMTSLTPLDNDTKVLNVLRSPVWKINKLLQMLSKNAYNHICSK